MSSMEMNSTFRLGVLALATYGIGSVEAAPAKSLSVLRLVTRIRSPQGRTAADALLPQPKAAESCRSILRWQTDAVYASSTRFTLGDPIGSCAAWEQCVTHEPALHR